MDSMGRLTGIVTLSIVTVLGGVTLLSTGALGAEFYGMLLPDIGVQDVIDYIAALIQNPNIYADFDYNAFIDFMTANYIGRYFLMAMGGIYMLSLLIMLFGVGRAKKALR